MTRTDRTKKVLLTGALIAGLVAGGAAIASAASSGGSAGSTGSSAATQPAAPTDQGVPRQRSDETLLTGDTASKVSEAALAKVDGGTIVRVETDADGNAAYEAHIQKADGSMVTVYVDESFKVVGQDAGMGPGPQGGPPPAQSGANA